MIEQFVTLEIAEELKKLGFNEKCLGFYYKKQFELLESYDSVKYRCDNGVKAPLWQQAFEFMRKNEIYINYNGNDFYTSFNMTSPVMQIISHEFERNTKNHYSIAREKCILKAIEILKKKKIYE